MDFVELNYNGFYWTCLNCDEDIVELDEYITSLKHVACPNCKTEYQTIT